MAVATASIRQVHGAVKILHPGVEQAIRWDFKAAAADRVLAKMILPGGEIRIASALTSVSAVVSPSVLSGTPGNL